MEHQMGLPPIGMMQGQPRMQYQPFMQNPQMQQPIGMMQGQSQQEYQLKQNFLQMHQGPYPQGLPELPTPAGGPSAGQPGVPPGPYPGGLQHQLTYPHNLLDQHQQQLQRFWQTQLQEIEQVNDFRTHPLPLARIKKIMKADEDVSMISAEAPVLFAKACEIFILELTLRSWMHTEENKRRTLQKNDISAAITRTGTYDFLVDIVPRDTQLKDEGALGGVAAGQPQQGVPPAMQQRQANMMGSAAMLLERPGMPMDPSMQVQQIRPPNMQDMPQQGQQPMQQLWSQPNSFPGAPQFE